ncbi:MAG: DnaJ domain-containing protein [Snowella sp.]|nr:DnaJ domain-containing protein [Snowella sp.]
MDYYEILEVARTATQREIKQSYRRLAKQFHPDSQHQAANHDSIIQLNAAYEVLGDVQRRNFYDQQLEGYAHFAKRDQRNSQAQSHYRQQRQAAKQAEQSLQQWMQTVYQPLNRLFFQVIRPLNDQIDELAADPFDDELMGNFQDYLEQCRQFLGKARFLFSSQPNPAEAAKIAVILYYCLNHLDDAIEELEQFTTSYDEHCLNTGKELFRLAKQLLQEAKLMAQQI